MGFTVIFAAIMIGLMTYLIMTIGDIELVRSNTLENEVYGVYPEHYQNLVGSPHDDPTVASACHVMTWEGYDYTQHGDFCEATKNVHMRYGYYNGTEYVHFRDFNMTCGLVG